MLKFGKCVSLSTYLRRFFGIIFNLSTPFSFCYYDAQGKQNFIVENDSFQSVPVVAMMMIRQRLINMNLMKYNATKLEDFLVKRYYEQHTDFLIRKWKAVDWEGFKTELNKIARDTKMLEYWQLIDDGVAELDLILQSGCDELLQLNAFAGILANLRMATLNGVNGSAPDYDSLDSDDYKTADVDDITKSYVEKNEFWTEADVTDYSRLSRMAQKCGKILVTKTGEAVVFVVSSTNIYSLIDSVWVDLRPIYHHNYILTNAEQETITLKPEAPKKKTEEPMGDSMASSNWLRENFEADNNISSLSIYGMNSTAKELYEKCSIKTRKDLTKNVQDDVSISEAIVSVKEYLEKKLESQRNNYPGFDEALWCLAAGRIKAAKNIFRLEGGRIRRN